MEKLDALVEWLGRNAPWVGYVLMSVLGGVVAHIRQWETANQMSYKDHIVQLFRRSVMAVLAGIIWWLLMQENGWAARPYAYVGASLVGLFSPEFFDFLWGLMKRWGARRAGLTDHNAPTEIGHTEHHNQRSEK